MAERSRRERGLEKFNEVYCGDIPAPPEGAMAFFDIMLEQVFAEVWTREQLSQRDRRLLILGAIAALGERDTFGIQVRAALKNQELDAEQARELLIHLAQYVGYPRVAGLVGEVERVIGEQAKEKT